MLRIKSRSIKVILRLMLGVCLVLCGSLLWSMTQTFPKGIEILKKEPDKQQKRMSRICIGLEQKDPLNKHQADLEPDSVCSEGYVPHHGEGGTCVLCPKGTFSLSNWFACERLLDCQHVRYQATKRQLLHSLVQWKYFKADWKSYEIIYATFNPMEKTSVDYSRSQLFSPSHNFLYPIGYCEEENVILFASNTNYTNSGNHLEVAFAKKPPCNTCMVRFRMVLDYVKIISRLHANDTVLCNSMTLDHLMSQFLITEDFTLVLATLDNLPSDTDGPILCQSSELTGKFVAPEQKWPYGTIKIFNVEEQPKYDKMSDIWKVPEVVSFFLKGSCDDELNYLQDIHMKCKSVSPHERPLAHQLVVEFESVWRLLFGHVTSV